MLKIGEPIMKRWICAFALLVLVCIPFPIHAEDSNEAAYSGYLIKLSTDVPMMLSRSSDLTPVGNGIYHTNSPEVIKTYQEKGLAEYVEPNYIVSLFDSVAGEDVNWGYGAVHAEYAANAGLTGLGIKVAVIDSGVNLSADGLSEANIAQGYNYINDSYDISDSSLSQHGTRITQIICASDSGGSLTGIAPGTEIVPLKCFENGTATLDVLLRALNDANNIYGCKVINMSWGMEEQSKSLEEAMECAKAAGVILIAAAGNEGNSVVNYPAGYDEVIGVGAVDSNLNLATFSQINNSVYITAPGVGIGGIQSNGTSFAAPFITAMAALLLENDVTMTPADFSALLSVRGMDLGTENYDTSYGYGFARLDWLLAEAYWQQSTISDNCLLLTGGVDADEIFMAAALYEENGRMISLQTLTFESVASRFRMSVYIDEKAVLCKLFYLRGGCSPYGSSILIPL